MKLWNLDPQKGHKKEPAHIFNMFKRASMGPNEKNRKLFVVTT